MNKRQILSSLLLLSLGLTAYGCGSSGSSSMEVVSDSLNNNTGLTVSLARSNQGTSGAFMDVNGDGLADQVVTAPAASSSPQKGVVLFYLGSSRGFPSTPIELTGEGEGDSFGSSFLPIDIDGDGKKTDFAIGALNAGGDAPLSGSVYIYKGGDTPTLVIKLKGEEPMDKFGWSIASGDINGDGKNDVAVSALYNTHDQFQGGAIYVYLGNGTAVSETPALTLYDNAGASKGLGYSVTAGDINGDDIADVIAGESARVLVWYGKNAISNENTSFSSPDVTIYGAPSGSTSKYGSAFGKAVAVIGDINGDGINDIAIGNPNRGTSDTYDNKGSVYIFKGSSYPSGTVIYEDDANGYKIAKITGVNDQDRFGSFILPAGDAVGMDTLTPGGRPDFIVSAVWGDTDTEKAAGTAYLFSGEHVSSMTENMSATHAEMEYNGDANGSGFGTFMSITKEGPDGILLIGAPLTSEGTGSVEMIKLSDGSSLTGGATGGTITGGGLDCH
ncbi:MAG: FG-GAP-like repeat-containing protein [Deltaproteobacteria bacterium]|nr:FG-GAP-like repeat-containing protein [Deltaproteobacteria bacterium]